MKRLLFCLAAALMLMIGASAANIDALYISCTVRDSGAVDYSMAISCRFTQVEKSITVPLAGKEIGSVSVSGAKWELERDDGWDRVVLTNGDGFIGRQTFMITYRTAASDALSDELTLWLTDSHWEENIQEVSFLVELPTEIKTPPTLTSGYSGTLYQAVEMTAKGFTGSLSSGLMAHESLTAKLTLPENFFSHRQLRQLRTLDWRLLVLLLLAALCVFYWARRLRGHRMTVHSRVLPPEGRTPTETPVILNGGDADPAALMPFWGTLGYLYVDFAGGELVMEQRMGMGSERPAHETEMFRTMFSRRRELWMPDRVYQQAAAQAARTTQRIWRARLFDRRGGSPSLLRLAASLGAGLALAASVTAQLPVGAGWTLLGILCFVPGMALGLLVQQAAGALRLRPWLHWKPLPGLAALVLLALVGRELYTIPALALQCFTGLVLAYGGRRTPEGTQALEELLGLRQFLLRASPRRLRELMARDALYLQTILPYAEQLGLANRLAARLGRQRIEEPAWLQADEPLRTAAALAKKEKALMARLRPQRESLFRHLMK